METRGRSAKKSPATGSKKLSYAEVVTKPPSPKKAIAKRSPSAGRGDKAKAAKSPAASGRRQSRAQSAEVKEETSTTACDVLLFYPNLIGYTRVLCMTLSFYYARADWKKTVAFYLCAFIGDVVDGYVARYFGQCSNFGGLLDMVTDRVSTAGFLAVLCSLYPEHSFGAVMLIVLDIASHWLHLASVSGHHKSKEVLLNRNALLQWYYSIYPLFGYCCVGAELFYVLLYILYFFPDPLLHQICFYGCLPACLLKQVVNVVQLWSAMENLALIDAVNINDKKK